MANKTPRRICKPLDMNAQWKNVVGKAYVISGATQDVRETVAKTIAKQNETQRVVFMEDRDRLAVAVEKKPTHSIGKIAHHTTLNAFNMCFQDIESLVTDANQTFETIVSETLPKGLPDICFITVQRLNLES